MKAIPIILLALMLIPANVAGQEELPDPGITPDSIFYGLDKAFERIQFALARDEVSKARLHLEIASERIAEGKAMADRGKPEYLPDLAEEYEENLGKSQEIAEVAKGLGKNTSEVDELVALATSMHTEVLEEILEKVPEQAKVAIERAIDRSARGQEESLNRLGEAAPERSADLYMRIAEKRLNRARERAEAGDSEEAEDLIEEYNTKVGKSLAMLEKARTMGRDVTGVQERVFAATSTHQEALQDVLERVPEEAKEAVEKAMEVSMRGREEALEALNISLPPQAERAKAGTQEEGGMERIIPKAPMKTAPPTTPHETPREEREEGITETPAPAELPEATELPETPINETEIPETPSPPETPVGQRGRP